MKNINKYYIIGPTNTAKHYLQALASDETIINSD